MGADPYDKLGVSRDDPLDVIEKKYRRLSLIFIIRTTPAILQKQLVKKLHRSCRKSMMPSLPLGRNVLPGSAPPGNRPNGSAPPRNKPSAPNVVDAAL
jgi:hypothetical protein